MSVINWVAFGGILVDLVIISIIISNAFWGYRRGLVNVIFQVLAFIVSLLILHYNCTHDVILTIY